MTSFQTTRIAVACSDARGLDSQVSRHFGRCAHFVFIDLDSSGQYVREEVVDNPVFQKHSPQALPQLLVQRGVSMVIADGMGEGAIRLLKQSGIQVLAGNQGSVRQVLEGMLLGTLTALDACADHGSHECHGKR